MLYSGINLHRRDLVVTTVDAEGTLVASKRVAASRDAVRGYFAQFPVAAITAGD